MTIYRCAPPACGEPMFVEDRLGDLTLSVERQDRVWTSTRGIMLVREATLQEIDQWVESGGKIL